MIEDDKHASNKKKNRLRQINKLQSILKIKFRNKSLLNRALTHRSYLNEAGPGARDNERLEYLGDSVLALVVNEYLFKRFEKYPEGDLAKIKSAVVSEATLFKVARELNLGSFLLMGRGEDLSGGRARPSILANTLEAVIGALYLDSGLKDCKKLVLSLLKGDIERIDSMESYRDPKTTLQEYVQKKYRERPLYEIIEESGPDHQKRFTVRLVVAGKSVAEGTGASKRGAEMEAARKALEMIYGSGRPF
ncbi:MAG TPA: ribonuclease III [Spirochaetota bacterium]|nr:ribonuclease III [Spirochaetota bacterium]HNU90697.1 ribonuclease III [Spirochaetota bacterium]HPV96632.1 ribonuclease III [Spirochaetota bacterium]